MQPSSKKINRNIHFYVLLIISIVLCIYFLKNFLSLIMIAFLTVLMINPIYKKLLYLLKNRKKIAITISLFIVILSILIPISILSTLVIAQTNTFIFDINNYFLKGKSFEILVNSNIDNINKNLSILPFRIEPISKTLVGQWINQNVYTLIQQAWNNIGQFLLQIITQISGGFLEFIPALIIYIILVASILPNQGKIITFVRNMSPFDNRIDDLYIKKLGAMAKSMIEGTFLIGLLQSIINCFFLWICGVPYVFFFAILYIFFAILPFGGTGTLTIPIAIIQMLFGNIWQGIFLIIAHILIGSNIDNIVRAKFVRKDAKIPTAIMFLGIFAGIQSFGMLGIIYGPLIMIFIYTTIQIYIKYFNNGEDLPSNVREFDV